MKKKFYRRWWFWLIIVLLVIGAIGSSKDDAQEPAESPAPIAVSYTHLTLPTILRV